MPLYQSSPVINFPNDNPYTRVTEFKYLTGQTHTKTSIVYEYPKAECDPYYPVPKPENGLVYKKYKALADVTQGVYFAGRLGTYKYYNMDQVVAQAMTLYRKIRNYSSDQREGLSLVKVKAAFNKAELHPSLTSASREFQIDKSLNTSLDESLHLKQSNYPQV